MEAKSGYRWIDPTTGNSRAKEVAEMLMNQQESDRGCAIFGAAILEDDLEALLRTYCRTDEASVKNVIDPLFRTYAPFSTFSAKIEVSYALGLIKYELKQSLDLFRKLRNDFAHEKGPISFQSPECQSRLLAILENERRLRGAAAGKDRTDEDEGAPVPGMGHTTKRQLIDRLAFCFCITGASVEISTARKLLLEGGYTDLHRSRINQADFHPDRP